MKFKLNRSKGNDISVNQRPKIISTDLILVMLILIPIRILYNGNFLDTLDNDSPSYLTTYSGDLLNWHVDIFRTPVYPYLIKCIRLFGNSNIISNVVLFQSLFSILSVVVLFFITSKIYKNRKVILISTLTYGLMLPIVSFDKVIRTESISISSIIIFISFLVIYLQKRTIFNAIIFTLFTLFLVMLRPSFIYLIPLTVFFWVVRLTVYKDELKIVLTGLITSTIVCCVVFGYSKLNEKSNGFFGISSVTNINQLDIIIRSKMHEKGSDPELTSSINNLLKDPEPYGGHWVLLYKITNQYPPKRVSTFITACIKSQPVVYLRRIKNTFFEIWKNNIFTNYANAKKTNLSFYIKAIENGLFSLSILHVLLFIAFDFIITILIWIKFKRLPIFKFLLSLIFISHFTFTVIGAQEEFSRLLSPVISCLVILFFLYVDMICCSINKSFLRNYIHSYLAKSV